MVRLLIPHSHNSETRFVTTTSVVVEHNITIGQSLFALNRTSTTPLVSTLTTAASPELSGTTVACSDGTQTESTTLSVASESPAQAPSNFFKIAKLGGAWR